MQKSTMLLVGAIVWISACGGGTNDASRSEAIGNTTPGQPVEIREPDAGYAPAFEGQTRAPGVKTTTPYDVRIVTDKLTKPWGIAVLPDGRFLLTEKEGGMRIVSTDGQVSEKITGMPEVKAGGQGGLLGLVLDPDFATNRMVYWAFTEPRNGANLTAVGKGRLSADEGRIENPQVIYRAEPAYEGDKHYGGRLLFDQSGNLYVTTADRFRPERRKHAQDQTSGLGKILRITKEGQAASGNPFSGEGAAIYTIGHRNIQGIALHPQTGDLWITEMGPQGGDELNLIEAGKNYGWPVITYGIEYNNDTIGQGITQQEGMEQPVYFWDPVLSPSGMTFYSGNAIPEWQNNLFIGGLNSHHIARLVLENRRVVGEERLLADQQQRFRAVVEGTDGALYAITDGGRLYRIGKP
ncbi:PQQ-dependent sugar dehydrogenase [Cesiribacter andamanensis]|uniref:Soluble aldose sugar dehydrogenase yliI n=1 Tax=Cesiribacter andamanensis AMV16 TaxID=1279009 RepID=M7MYS9_9BACT|nr:PQQ-dependent sugar dehydrogenase [Cesiribacter andamanensis]EMR01618.1 Soluble aldose sugar dehydrogenase yliI precursor [Cesiribacter andamanensis AMV16]